VKTRPQMAGALREWLIQSHTFNSTADLPPWKDGSAAPTSSTEFPFYADAALNLARAEQARGAARERLTRLMGLWGAQTQFRLPERLPDVQ